MSCFSPDAGHVSEHADRPGDAAAGVEHEVLAVVSPQQLHVLGHADGADLTTVMMSSSLHCAADQVDGEEQHEGGGHGPECDDHHGEALHPQQVGVAAPHNAVIPGGDVGGITDNLPPVSYSLTYME